MMCPFLATSSQLVVSNAQRHRESPTNALPEMARIATTKCVPMRAMNACKCKPSLTKFLKRFFSSFRLAKVLCMIAGLSHPSPCYSSPAEHTAWYVHDITLQHAVEFVYNHVL